MEYLFGVPILTLLFIASLSWSAVHSYKIDYYDLYDTYFSNTTYYKKEIRPAESEYDPLVVSMNFYLLSILDVNEKQQMLQTSARLEMGWYDDFLEWNPSDYDGITEMLVPQENIYVPDIVLGNSVSAQKRIGYKTLPVRLNNNGSISWQPTLLLETDCDIDITYFPFETQKCNIDFETAVSRAFEIDIDVYKGISNVLLDDFTTNGQWSLVDTSAENLSNEDSKTKIRFTLVLERRRTFYLLNIILPVFFLSLTSSLIFAIPAEEGEKMGTGITILLAFAVYLTIVSELIPNTSLQVSVLGLYLTILLGQSAVSVVICTYILRLHAREDEERVGPCTTRVITLLRYVMCLGEYEGKGDKDDKEEEPPITDLPLTRSQSDLDPRMSPPGTRPSQEGRMSPYEGRMSPQGEVYYTGRSSQQGSHSPTGRPQSGGNASNMSPFHSQEKEKKEGEISGMTWKEVAETLDWFFFLFFTLSTFLVTVVSLLVLHFGSINDAPTIPNDYDY